METKLRRILNRWSGAAAVTAFVAQPVPAGDELLVIPIHYALCVRLARARGVPIRKLPWRSIQRVIWYGAAARLAVTFSLGWVPILGGFSNAATAVALTEYLGHWLDAILENPDQAPPEVTIDALKALFTNAIKKARPGSKSGVADGGTPPEGAP